MKQTDLLIVLSIKYIKIMTSNIDVLNVLWTGGLDSTYLVAKLCWLGKNVQPFYIIEEGRSSLKKEIDAIKKITVEIKNNSSVKGIINETIFFDKKNIIECKDITLAWKRLNAKYQLGSQYEWLARFAKQENLLLMVGVQMEARGKVVHTLEGADMKRKTIQSDIDVFSTTGCQGINPDADTLFRNIYFPRLIVGKTKEEEWRELHDMGLGNVAEMTWFCHRPIWGFTCGHCNPCKDALNEKMAFRVSKIGYLLGSLRLLWGNLKSRIKGNIIPLR